MELSKLQSAITRHKGVSESYLNLFYNISILDRFGTQYNYDGTCLL